MSDDKDRNRERQKRASLRRENGDAKKTKVKMRRLRCTTSKGKRASQTSAALYATHAARNERTCAGNNETTER